MTVRHWIFALRSSLAAAPAFAQQPVAAGRIKVASGSAFIVRAGALVPAQAGQDVFEADSLQNGRRRPSRDHAEGRYARLPRPRQRSAARSLRVRARPTARLGLSSRSSAASWRTSRGGSPSSRPTPSASKRRRQWWASAERRWRFASCRNEPDETLAVLMAIARRRTRVGRADRSGFSTPSAPGQSLIVLLPDPDDGTVGRAIVSNPSGTAELAAARATRPRSLAEPAASARHRHERG